MFVLPWGMAGRWPGKQKATKLGTRLGGGRLWAETTELLSFPVQWTGWPGPHPAVLLALGLREALYEV